jgi:hypothetical protein
MKITKLIILLTAIVFISSLRGTAQRADFDGTWKLDRTKSTLMEYSPILTRIDIKINGDSLLTERYYNTGNGQEYTFTKNVTLDGKEHAITIYEMPRKTRASWSEQDGLLIIESTTTFTGDAGAQDFISKENWNVDKTNNIITISCKNKVGTGESEEAFILNKVVSN